MTRRKGEIPRNLQRTPIGVRPVRTRHEQHEVLGTSWTISPIRGRHREQGKPKEHLNLSQTRWNEFRMDRKAKPDRQRICHVEKGKPHTYGRCGKRKIQSPAFTEYQKEKRNERSRIGRIAILIGERANWKARFSGITVKPPVKSLFGPTVPKK